MFLPVLHTYRDIQIITNFESTILVSVFFLCNVKMKLRRYAISREMYHVTSHRNFNIRSRIWIDFHHRGILSWICLFLYPAIYKEQECKGSFSGCCTIFSLYGRLFMLVNNVYWNIIRYCDSTNIIGPVNCTSNIKLYDNTFYAVEIILSLYCFNISVCKDSVTRSIHIETIKDFGLTFATKKYDFTLT